MNEKYFVVKDAGKTVIYGEQYDPMTERITLVSSSFDDIRNLYKNEKVLIAEKCSQKGGAWLEHPKRRTYMGGIVFAPNKTVRPDQYNLWRGYGVEAKQGAWSLMKAHILNIICASDKEKYNYVINWLSRAVQQPELPGCVAIVLQGGQGTGKGYFARYTGKLCPAPL